MAPPSREERQGDRDALNHNLEAYLYAYIDAAGIGQEKDAPLFRTAIRKTKTLTERRVSQKDVFSMIRRRAAVVGIETRIGSQSLRDTGITACLTNAGTLDAAQRMVGHSDASVSRPNWAESAVGCALISSAVCTRRKHPWQRPLQLTPSLPPANTRSRSKSQ